MRNIVEISRLPRFVLEYNSNKYTNRYIFQAFHSKFEYNILLCFRTEPQFGIDISEVV